MEELDVCGKFFMYAPFVKSWGCFCCTGVEDFKYHQWWNIYAREGHFADDEGKPAQGFVSQYAQGRKCKLTVKSLGRAWSSEACAVRTFGSAPCGPYFQWDGVDG